MPSMEGTAQRTGKPVIGIAGSIAAGKSTVARLLTSMGCLVSDSDALARASFADPMIQAELRRWWGDAVFEADGSVDRKAIASVVFSDPSERLRLEGLTHPWIGARRVEQFAEAAGDPSIVALVIDAPLLFEAKLDAVCDATIVVDAPWEERVRRVSSGRGWDEAELRRREESQMSLDAKRERADYVIWNDGDEAKLEHLVREVLSAIQTTSTGRQPD